MNLVDVIKGQLSGPVLGSLSSTLGIDQASLEKAISGGVPAFLALLAKLVSSPGGASKVVDTLRQPDLGSMGDLGDILKGGKHEEVATRGGDILGSLLGGGGLAALVGVLAKFSGLALPVIRKLLTLLGPVILSAIAGQLKTRGLSPQGLTSLMDEQKSNIHAALPPGLSLADVTGPATAAADGLPKWLIPAGLAAIAALAIWYFAFNPTPEAPPPSEVVQTGEPVKPKGSVPSPTEPAEAKKAELPGPDVAAVTKDLNEATASATKYLADVKDVPSADVALPKLEDVNGTLDKIKGLWDKLPDSAKATVTNLVKESLPKIKDLVTKVLAIPGVAEKLKPVLDALVAKLTGMA